MPHEFKCIRNYVERDALSENQRAQFEDKSELYTIDPNKPDYKGKLRRRSMSYDNISQKIFDYNMRTGFGRAYYDQLSDNSMKDKVGPLKIIRLPSERSMH